MASNDGWTQAEIEQLYAELRGLMWTLAKLGRQATEQSLQAEGIELSWLQMGVLRVLTLEGEHTISELSKKLMLDPSTLVASVDALERKGYLTRTRDPQDRRRVILGLTPSGRGVAGRFDTINEQDPILHSLKAMGRQSGEAFLDLLRRLVRGIPDGEDIVQHFQERIRLNQALAAKCTDAAAPKSHTQGD